MTRDKQDLTARKENVETCIEPIELNQIDTIVPNNEDDIFILCASDEERCMGSISKLAEGYRAENFFLLEYTDPNPKREEQIKKITSAIRKRGNLIENPIDEDNPLIGINSLLSKIQGYIQNIDKPRITFDFTTIMKWNLLLLLRGLEMNDTIKYVRFLYTEPLKYETDLINPLSFGVREIFPIPTFTGSYDFSKESLLVILLGYEGDRALSLFEKVEPSECLLFIAAPPYREEWRGMTEKMNAAIINLVGDDKKREIDARNPLLVSKCIKDELQKKEYSKFNHFIAPLGTKPQTLGLHLYLKSDPVNTIILYGRPLRHNSQFYSEGIGRTWHLPVKNTVVS